MGIRKVYDMFVYWTNKNQNVKNQLTYQFPNWGSPNFVQFWPRQLYANLHLTRVRVRN